MVGTLSQSDYRCMQGVRTQGMRTQGCAHTGVVGTLSQSDYRWGHSANQITGACRGCACRGCVHRGHAHRGCTCRGCAHRGVRAGVVGTLSQSDYRWGHSANQITGGDTQPIRLQVHAGGAHAGGVRAGDVCTGGARAGVVGTLSQSDYRWGHSANQITGACRGCTRRGGGDT